MSDKNIDQIYVELDCLLDTRAGTLSKMVNVDEMVKILLDRYHDREIDIFPVNMQAYKFLYANRGIEILQASTLTGMIPLLRHLAATLRKDQLENRPGTDGVEIIVNTYPYTLTGDTTFTIDGETVVVDGDTVTIDGKPVIVDGETVVIKDNSVTIYGEATLIAKSMYVWMDGLARSSLVSMKTEELTPHYCKSAYKIMIMYDALGWMESHHKGFEYAILPEVMLMTPKRYMERVPTPEEIREKRCDPWQAIEATASALIDLKMIDMKYFCIVQPQPLTA